MDAEKTLAKEERKAVRDLVNISFETWQLEQPSESSNSLEVDGWVSNRNASSRDKSVRSAGRRKIQPRRHFRSFSARKPAVMAKEKSTNVLLSGESCDDISENSFLLAASFSRPPRVIQPFGFSSGNIYQARDLLKPFPPRKPRRDSKVFPYIAYSLVKQAAAVTDPKATPTRRFSQPPSAEGTPKPPSKPPRPSHLREATSSFSIKTATQRDEKENKAADRTFHDNVIRFMQPTAREVLSMQQKQIKRLNTAIALARFNS